MAKSPKSLKSPKSAGPLRGQKRCSAEGCRKLREPGSDFCRLHPEEGPVAPLERVVKLSELETLKFGKLDAEIRNAMQGIKLRDYEADKLRRDFELQLKSISAARQQLQGLILSLRPEYDELVSGLAVKYGVSDHTKMTIDPSTGVVRDVGK